MADPRFQNASGLTIGKIEIAARPTDPGLPRNLDQITAQAAQRAHALVQADKRLQGLSLFLPTLQVSYDLSMAGVNASGVSVPALANAIYNEVVRVTAGRRLPSLPPGEQAAVAGTGGPVRPPNVTGTVQPPKNATAVPGGPLRPPNVIGTVQPPKNTNATALPSVSPTVGAATPKPQPQLPPNAAGMPKF